MTLAELGPEERALLHDMAEKQRRSTEEGFATVRSRYGWAYANGWRSGRNCLADLIDPEVENR